MHADNFILRKIGVELKHCFGAKCPDFELHPRACRVMNKNRERKGLSVVEIMVVACLGSVILLAGSLMMSRTTRTFKKGTDMINTQVLMDTIVERLRTDVRMLTRVVECKPDKFVFLVNRDDTGAIKEEQITYTYNSSTKTLVKSDASNVYFDFHGPKQVETFLFHPILDETTKQFSCVNVAMQLKSDEHGEGQASSLSIVCQFYSKCLGPNIPFGR
ncbi:MAG: hypothetical protein WA705_06940 [Candidatus Ozemobacteraceae bacterium]